MNKLKVKFVLDSQINTKIESSLVEKICKMKYISNEWLWCSEA